jgi:hypothetical protein
MKLLFGLIIGTAIVVLVIALYSALIIAGRSDEQANIENNEGANDLFNKKICPRCKTGKYTYDLDPKSEACPYIGCWRRNKYSFYKPLDKHSKSSSFHKVIEK